MLRPLLASATLLSLLTLAGCDECAEVDCACLQGGIFVTVVDATTKQPLVGVKVARGNELCPSNGTSYVCNVAAGNHTLQVSVTGYTSKTVSVVVPEPQGEGCCICGEAVQETVELTPAP